SRIRLDDAFAYPIRTSAPLLAGRRRPAPTARPERARQSWRAGRTGLAGLSVLHRHTVVAERGTHHRFSTWHAICRAGAAVAPRAPDHGIAVLLEAADPRNGGRLASAGGRVRSAARTHPAHPDPHDRRRQSRPASLYHRRRLDLWPTARGPGERVRVAPDSDRFG